MEEISQYSNDEESLEMLIGIEELYVLRVLFDTAVESGWYFPASIGRHDYHCSTLLLHCISTSTSFQVVVQ